MPGETSAERAANVLAAQRAKWADSPPVNTMTRQQARRLRAQKKKALAAMERRHRLQIRRDRVGLEPGPVSLARREAEKRDYARRVAARAEQFARKARRAARRLIGLGSAA